MPIRTFAFPNYYASSWQRLGVSACAQFEIFVIKVGSTCENKTDLDEKRIFHYKLWKKLSEAHRSIFVFSKYHCTTLTVELELDVSVCTQLKILTYKNSFTWLNFTKTLHFGPNNLSQIDVKRRNFFYHRKRLKEKLKSLWSWIWRSAPTT